MEKIKKLWDFVSSEKTTVFVLLTLISIAVINGDTHWPKWTVAEYVGTFLLGTTIYWWYGLMPGMAVTWTVLSGLQIFADQRPRPIEVSGAQILAIENVAMKATIAFLLVVVPLAFSSKKIQEHIEEWLGVICFMDSAYVVYRHLTGQPAVWVGGVFGNSSMNGSFIAVTYAFLASKPENITYHLKSLKGLSRWEWLEIAIDSLALALPVWAVFLCGASIPVVAMGLVWASYILFVKFDPTTGNYRKVSWRAFWCVFYLVLFMWLGQRFVPEFYFSSGRYPIWKASLQWWLDPTSPHGRNIWETLKDPQSWLGYGNGEYFLLGSVIQITHHIGGSWWGWAHNDWLQTLIEQGIIGLGIYVGLFISALRRCLIKGYPYLTQALIAYGFVAFFNFPAHTAHFALLGTFIAIRIFDRA